MKHTLRLLILGACLIGPAQAQEWATDAGSCFFKGARNISVGFSVPWIGPNAAFDYAFHPAISAGGIAGYIRRGYSSYWTYHYLPILARAAFHPFNLAVLSDKIPVRDKIDVYVGPVIGYSIGWASWEGSGSTGTDPDVGWFTVREYIGARYFFSEKLSVFVEESSAVGYFNGGLSFLF